MRNTSGLRPPFPKGVSGNPRGRPKTAALSQAYREKLAELYPRDPKGRTYAQVIADNIVKKAVKGNLSAASEIADRVEGRPRQSLELDNPSGPAPTINIQFVAVEQSTEIGSVQTQFRGPKQLEADNAKTPE